MRTWVWAAPRLKENQIFLRIELQAPRCHPQDARAGNWCENIAVVALDKMLIAFMCIVIWLRLWKSMWFHKQIIGFATRRIRFWWRPTCLPRWKSGTGTSSFNRRLPSVNAVKSVSDSPYTTSPAYMWVPTKSYCYGPHQWWVTITSHQIVVGLLQHALKWQQTISK